MHVAKGIDLTISRKNARDPHGGGNLAVLYVSSMRVFVNRVRESSILSGFDSSDRSLDPYSKLHTSMDLRYRQSDLLAPMNGNEIRSFTAIPASLAEAAPAQISMSALPGLTQDLRSRVDHVDRPLSSGRQLHGPRLIAAVDRVHPGPSVDLDAARGTASLKIILGEPKLFQILPLDLGHLQ